MSSSEEMCIDTSLTDSSDSDDGSSSYCSSTDDNGSGNFVSTKSIKDLDDQLEDKDISEFMLEEGKKRYNEGIPFDLLYRRSQGELLKETVAAVQDAKAAFQTKLREAASFYFSNINDVMLMDKVCNDVPENVESGKSLNPVIQRLSDGTLKLNCPIKDCSTSSLRLKRHLLNQHENINADGVKTIVEMTRKMEKNKLASEKCYIDEKASETIKYKKHRPLHHVDRKTNFVKCFLCNSIVSNISQHLHKKHKLTKSTKEQSDALEQCAVIPKVYTRTEGKKVVELRGSEYNDARSTYGKEIDEEHSVMVNLKKYRNQMNELVSNIQKSNDEGEKESLQEELRVSSEKYKEFRYRDTRKYSDRTKVWKESYESYLNLRDNYNPKRCASMAIDVIIRYEEKAGPISFQDLQNMKYLRRIVQNFKDASGMQANSKIKYLKMFCNLLSYLFTDCDSPEKSNEEDDLSKKMLNSILLKEAQNEVDNVIVSLLKETGKERLKSRDKSTKNLLTKEDLKIMSDAIRSDILKILSDDQNDRSLYSVSKVLQIRNDLMAIGFLNLGRRTMEMTTMTLEELKDAERTELQNGEIYHVVQVLEQKSLRNGKKAAVTFKNDEYKVLNIFVNELRGKICHNNGLQCVFPSSDEGGRQLTLGGVWKILKKYKAPSGIKLTSQIVRKSKVTNSRTLALTSGQKDATAFAMGHDTATGDRYYAMHNLIDSTNACLSLEKSTSDASLAGPSSASTPLASGPNPEDLLLPSRVQKIHSVKRVVHFEKGSESSELEDLDSTVMNLRAKKLRLGDKEAEVELNKSIKKIVETVRESGDMEQLYSKKGLLSVKFISQKLQSNLRKKFSVKRIRAVANKHL